MDLNITTPVNNLGFGLVGTNIVLALERCGYKPALWPIGPVEVTNPDSSDVLRRAARRTHLYNPDAPSLRIYHQFDLAHHVGRRVHAALPIFELNHFREVEFHHLNSQDVTIVASQWAKDILIDNGLPEHSIGVAPFGVDTSIFRVDPYIDHTAGVPTTFLNVGKWEVRKGHDFLVEAFDKAFEQTDNVCLQMLCQNPVVPNQKYNEEWNSLYMNSKMGRAGKIKLLPRQQSQSYVASIMAHADCGVFPARAEGWNMELAEMMAMGKHVITTFYSAHTEYCNEQNAHLIEVDGLESAYDGVWFTGQGEWARLGENAISQLVEHMRNIHIAKQEKSLALNQAGVDTFRNLTWDKCAQKIGSFLGVTN